MLFLFQIKSPFLSIWTIILLTFALTWDLMWETPLPLILKDLDHPECLIHIATNLYRAIYSFQGIQVLFQYISNSSRIPIFPVSLANLSTYYDERKYQWLSKREPSIQWHNILSNQRLKGSGIGHFMFFSCIYVNCFLWDQVISLISYEIL